MYSKKFLCALLVAVAVIATPSGGWALSIFNTSMPNAVVGQDYRHQFSSSGGGAAGVEWSIDPPVDFVPGLYFFDGLITGQPTQSGPFYFTVSLRSRNTNESTSANVSLTVLEAGSSGGGGGGEGSSDTSLPPSIRGNLQDFKVAVNGLREFAGLHGGNVQYYLAADNGTPPFKWAIVKGEIPRGLGLYACDTEGYLINPSHNTDRFLYFGDLDEVPVEPGDYNFTVRVTDSQGRTAEEEFSGSVGGTSFEDMDLEVLEGETITPQYNDYYLDFNYDQVSIAVIRNPINPPYTWTVVKGVLPDGLDIGCLDRQPARYESTKPSGNQGRFLFLYGTPQGGVGIYTFMVKVTDADGRSVRMQKRVKIEGDKEAENILPNGEVTLTDEPDPVIIGTLPDGKSGTAYSGHVSASEGTAPYTWNVTYRELPEGLSLACSDSETEAGSGTTGRYAHLVGTPKYSSWGGGYYTFTLSVKDAKGNSSAKLFTVKIAEGESKVDPAPLPSPSPSTLNISGTFPASGTVGQEYTGTIEITGGTSPYTWGYDENLLPEGLSMKILSGTKLQLSGTPVASGTYKFTINVTDNDGGNISREFSVSIGEESTPTPKPNPISDDPAPVSSGGGGGGCNSSFVLLSLAVLLLFRRTR